MSLNPAEVNAIACGVKARMRMTPHSEILKAIRFGTTDPLLQSCIDHAIWIRKRSDAVEFWRAS